MRAIKDSVIYLAGELTSRAMPFLLLPYLARKLGVDGFGELSYYQTFLALFGIVIGLSQEGAIARYFYFYGKRSMGLVLNIGYFYSSVIALGIFFVSWLLQSHILMILTVCALFQSFLSVQLSIRQCQKQAFSYIYIQLCYAFLSAILTIAMLEYFSEDLIVKRFWAIVVANVSTTGLAYMVYIRSLPRKSFSFLQYKRAFLYVIGFGFPLLFHHISLFLRGQLDRIFIYHQFSEVELGLYAMGAQIAAILLIMLQAINKALIPYFYEGLKMGSLNISDIHKCAFLSLFIVPFPAIVIWGIPEEWLTWLLGEEFIGTKYYIVFFFFSTMLTMPYLILVNYLFYYGENKLISFCSIFSTLVYILILFSIDYVENIPYASVGSAVTILVILYFITLRVSKAK
ncbi:MAG: oligosaccharide flippase family protein [Lonepinella koalarum]|nr:oligosaccharide flippase family protein [Lonepinella koalarum]